MRSHKSKSGIYTIAGSILPRQNDNRKMILKKAIESSGNYFLILLFTYAGLTKLLERDYFYLNLLNSPLLVTEKTWTVIASWLVPLMELFVVFLLVYPKTKLKGLYISLGLLILYTFYIMALIFLAPYQPCSCGGIIAFFSWKQQLWLTLGSLGFAAWTLFLQKNRMTKTL